MLITGHAVTPSLRATQRFDEPPWAAPLDTAAAIRAMPGDATISGMFLHALVEEAARRGYSLPSARDRYVPFRFYPLQEHSTLMIETCAARFPELPTRQALRRLGRGAPTALLSSTLGRIVLGSAEGVHSIVQAMANAYPLNARPSQVAVLEQGQHHVVVSMTAIHYFLDCHHVGAFEGVLRYAGVAGTVKIASHSATSADLLLEWER